MITGFSYNTRSGQWYADYENNNKYYFKPIYHNKLGYFIKNGSRKIYFTDEQEKHFKTTRKEILLGTNYDQKD